MGFGAVLATHSAAFAHPAACPLRFALRRLRAFACEVSSFCFVHVQLRTCRAGANGLANVAVSFA
eukprot:2904834-Pyramimonas_sp.AAC.1